MSSKPPFIGAATLERLHSAVSGTVWPAIPPPSGALPLAIQFQLARSEWWSGEKLKAAQFRQLAQVLQHAHANVPFYREQWTRCGYQPDVPLTGELFMALPLLRRSDLQQRFGELKATTMPAGHGTIVEDSTTGSTGVPVRFLKTSMTRLYWEAVTLRDHLWHQRDFSGVLAVIRSKVKPGAYSGWGPSTDVVLRTGPSYVCDIATDVDSQLDWLVEKNPDYLLTLATNGKALALRSLERGIKLPRLREVRVFGETLPPDARELCRRAWNVPLTDCYSSNEVGYMALQCQEHEHYHVQAEHNLVEVLDERGRPCTPGQVGRVVVTTLHNFALPLIRYEIGDYAEVGAPCACGRGLPVLKRVLGRTRNMLVLPDGRRHWPSFPSKAWSGVVSIRQLQLIQDAPDHIEARLVLADELTAEEADKLIKILQGCLAYPFPITLRRVETIERTPGSKYEDFICRINSAPTKPATS